MQTVDTSGLPIGMTLRVERTLAKVSLTVIASAVGISIGHLSRIETGDRTPTDALVKSIRDAIADHRKAAA